MKLHLRNQPVALYYAKINPEYNPTTNEVLLNFSKSLSLIIYQLLPIDVLLSPLHLIETSPPLMSASGGPIKYCPTIENLLIGHKAPSVQKFMKGKHTLAIKTTFKKKRQRTTHNSPSASIAPTPNISVVTACCRSKPTGKQ
jgi:hypothetical protein